MSCGGAIQIIPYPSSTWQMDNYYDIKFFNRKHVDGRLFMKWNISYLKGKRVSKKYNKK
jgi:hypothetical protein